MLMSTIYAIALVSTIITMVGIILWNVGGFCVEHDNSWWSFPLFMFSWCSLLLAAGGLATYILCRIFDL